MEQDVLYERKDDGSPGKALVLCASNLGDIELSIIDFGIKPLTKETVIFTTVAFGGGRSPNVRNALEDLADAIEKDNKERPVPEDFKIRKINRK